MFPCSQTSNVALAFSFCSVEYIEQIVGQRTSLLKSRLEKAIALCYLVASNIKCRNYR
jgi:hypothetical protein